MTLIWENKKIKSFLIILMGFIATFVGIYFPLILSVIDPNTIISVGGTNLGLIFLFSSFMIGYYIGEMVRPDEGEDIIVAKEYGFAIFGVFLGFIAIFGLNVFIFKEDFSFFFTLGLFGSSIALMTFLANITDFIKNKQFSEENFRKLVKFIGIFGVYQYLVSSYVLPVVDNISSLTLPFLIIVLIMAIALTFIFLQEIRGLLPKWLEQWIVIKFTPQKSEKGNAEESNQTDTK